MTLRGTPDPGLLANGWQVRRRPPGATLPKHLREGEDEFEYRAGDDEPWRSRMEVLVGDRREAQRTT